MNRSIGRSSVRHQGLLPAHVEMFSENQQSKSRPTDNLLKLTQNHRESIRAVANWKYAKRWSNRYSSKHESLIQNRVK